MFLFIIYYITKFAEVQTFFFIFSNEFIKTDDGHRETAGERGHLLCFRDVAAVDFPGIVILRYLLI